MKQNNFIVKNIKDLEMFLDSKEIQENIKKSKSILVQIFITISDKEKINFIKILNKTIEEKIPKAIIVGMTTSSQIADGKTIVNSNVVSITFFESTNINAIALKCSNGDEEVVGECLGKKIMDSYSNISAVLIFATVTRFKPDEFIEIMSKNIDENIQLFGGATAICLDNQQDRVFKGQEILKEGVVAVVFSGEDLEIEKYAYIGWQPLSKEMTVTKVENSCLVKEIDGETPFSIYEKYLGVEKNEENFMNALEFPILVNRDNQQIARVFGKYTEDGGAITTGNFKEGEKIRIGYGNPDSIIKNAKSVHDKMKKFNPQAIFIYSCDIRQMFLQEYIKLEVEPFQCIAPTMGAYTYGELFGTGQKTLWENMALVSVGIKEGKNKTILEKHKECYKYEYKYKYKQEGLTQVNLVLKLVNFIRSVVEDLEETQEQLQLLSITDTLTELNNRGKIEDILIEEIKKSKITKTNLSIVLLDIDHFKLVNDTYGHHIGDVVLKKVAHILKSNIRKNDIVGRWGGEEFMIVLKNTSLANAIQVAERIRKNINNYDFEHAGKISASFGVIEVNKMEDGIKALNRVDKALYEAKNTGRNKVVYLEYK